MKTFQPLGFPKISPFKCGEIDAILNNPCASPWAKLGYSARIKNEKYLAGYLHGKAMAKIKQKHTL